MSARNRPSGKVGLHQSLGGWRGDEGFGIQLPEAQRVESWQIFELVRWVSWANHFSQVINIMGGRNGEPFGGKDAAVQDGR
jgi:hypothetical protein